MSSIYGGFEEVIYTSGNTGAATAIGITTRLNPILDTSNINIRGTGRRGLYNILLGMRQPQFTMDILPTNINFIESYQDGQTMPKYLHYVYNDGADGLSFEWPRFNRVSVEARHNEAITATIELWAENVTDLVSFSWGDHNVTPYRWSDSSLTIGPAVDPETKWWSWRYEINNNLQRLGNVASGATRDIKARHRDVTGLIVKDLESFDEWVDLMSEQVKFNITIEVDSVDLINQDACRWGRLEAPVGPEDLQAKRFPFTAIDTTGPPWPT